MPLYEYRCSRCNTVFEVLQKISDAPLTEHPGCGGTVERQFSPPALQFKGSGFYITDYAKGSNGKAAPAKAPESKTPAPKTESPSAAKSDS
jgi:putative FmdB family regulatory protein